MVTTRPILVALLLLFAPARELLGQENKPDPGRNLSFYRQFLLQAEKALERRGGEELARRLLEVCPEDLRHFEWYYLYAKANPRGFTFRGHRDRVRGAAFSADGKMLASAGADGHVNVWSMTPGWPRLRLADHEGAVLCVAFHPQGKLLASGGADTTILFWDPHTGKRLGTYGFHPDGVTRLAFSPDGTVLASLTRAGSVHLFDWAKAKTRAAWKIEEDETFLPLWGARSVGWMAAGWGPSTLGTMATLLPRQPRELTCLAFSSDGKILALGDTRHEITLWNTASGLRVAQLRGHEDVVAGLAFHPDGKRLLSAGGDGLRVWQADGDKWMSQPPIPEAPLFGLALNRQGTALATVGSEKAKVWYEPFAGPTRNFDLAAEGAGWVLFHPNGQTLATEGPDNTILLHETAGETALIQAAQPLWSVQVNKEQILVSLREGAGTLAPTPDGATRNRVLSGHQGAVRALIAQPQGKLLASAGVDAVVRIWGPRDDKPLHLLKAHKGIVRALAFSPDGKLLASAGEDKTIRLWDPVLGKEQRTLRGHKGIVTSVLFLPAGDLLASASGDGTIRIWNAATGKTLQTWTAHEDLVSHLALTSDGKRLASAGTDRKIKVWEPHTGKPLQSFAGLTSMTQALAFTPDGKRLATGNGLGGVTLWDPDTGQAVYTFARAAGAVNAVTFSPDGTTLYSGGYDGTIMQWKARRLD